MVHWHVLSVRKVCSHRMLWLNIHNTYEEQGQYQNWLTVAHWNGSTIENVRFLYFLSPRIVVSMRKVHVIFSFHYQWWRSASSEEKRIFLDILEVRPREIVIEESPRVLLDREDVCMQCILLWYTMPGWTRMNVYVWNSLPIATDKECNKTEFDYSNFSIHPVSKLNLGPRSQGRNPRLCPPSLVLLT